MLFRSGFGIEQAEAEEAEFASKTEAAAKPSKAEVEAIANAAAVKEAAEAVLVVCTAAVASSKVTSGGLPTAGEADGETLADTNRVLLIGQVSKVQNGPWIARSAKAWERPPGYASGSAQGVNQYIEVQAGATKAGYIYVLKSPRAEFVVDTAETEWEENPVGSGVVPNVITSVTRTTLGIEALALDPLGRFNTALGYQVMHVAAQTETLFTGNIKAGENKIKNIAPVSGTMAELYAKLQFGGFLSCAAHPNALITNADLSPLPTKAEFEASKELSMEGNAVETVVGATILQLWGASYNTGVGYSALAYVSTGSGNTAVGEIAGSQITTGEENTVVGCEALIGRETGKTIKLNVAIGFGTLNDCRSNGNTAVGTNAMVAHQVGEYNVAVGIRALQWGKTGEHNTAVGAEALQNMQAEHNVSVGSQSMKVATTANQCVAVGYAALTVATTGTQNTAVGNYAGGGVTSGSENTLLGAGAGSSLKTTSGNVCLGNEAGKTAVGSNELFIANNETTPWIQGAESGKKIGFMGGTPTARVSESLSTGALGTPTLTTPYGYATKAEAEAAFKFIEKASAFMHASGLTA